ncbi:unnamed protein product, partial [Prunus brigantina]
QHPFADVLHHHASPTPTQSQVICVYIFAASLPLHKYVSLQTIPPNSPRHALTQKNKKNKKKNFMLYILSVHVLMRILGV